MTVLNHRQVEGLYDRIASRYETLLLGFGLLGTPAQRRILVRKLNLRSGDTVVDLCCGTGANFSALQKVVGASGTIIGVDLSAAMLEQANARCRREGWQNVRLVKSAVETFNIPPEARAVLSTFGLEMVPSYARIIEKVASQLDEGAHLGLLGLKHPEGWPEWLIDIGVWLTSSFGVSRDYADFQPWKAAAEAMDIINYQEFLFGAAYRCVAVHASIEE